LHRSRDVVVPQRVIARDREVDPHDRRVDKDCATTAAPARYFETSRRDDGSVDDVIALRATENDRRCRRDEYPHFSPASGQQVDIVRRLRGQ
jgi:hypothetical protein